LNKDETVMIPVGTDDLELLVYGIENLAKALADKYSGVTSAGVLQNGLGNDYGDEGMNSADFVEKEYDTIAASLNLISMSAHIVTSALSDNVIRIRKSKGWEMPQEEVAADA